MVLQIDAVVEVAGESADDGFIAGVGPAESAAGEAAEVFVGPDEDDCFAHFFGLHGGDDARRGAAVNDDVVLLGCGDAGECREDEECVAHAAEGGDLGGLCKRGLA